jgi:hypothetical protein
LPGAKGSDSIKRCVPALTITPPADNVLCNNTIDTNYTDVVFTMKTSNGEKIKAPRVVNASDGRTCRATGPTKHSEWGWLHPRHNFHSRLCRSCQ